MLQFKDDIAEGTAAILVKDESLRENPDAEFYKYLKAEGFQMWSKSSGCYKGVDWIYVNLNTKCIARGKPGIPVVSAFGNHAVTIEDFKDIYHIYRKYEGLGVLQLTKLEQEEWQKKIRSIEDGVTKTNEEDIPTLSEFMELVKECYWTPDWVIGKAEAMRYFYSDEAQNYIRESYKRATQEYKKGKLGVQGFRIGTVSGVAYALYMMWE